MHARMYKMFLYNACMCGIALGTRLARDLNPSCGNGVLKLLHVVHIIILYKSGLGAYIYTMCMYV